MLSSQLSTALVIAATLLMAVVIFAPVRAAERETVTVSYAPPLPAPEPWEMPAPPFASAFEPPALEAPMPETPPRAAWTTRVDLAAAACDESERCALIGALSDVASPWAVTILEAAADGDPSALVRDAAASALRRADARYRP